MNNELLRTQHSSNTGRIDQLGKVADKVANSWPYRRSPIIVSMVCAALVACGINKGLSEQHNYVPEKPDHSITVVDN